MQCENINGFGSYHIRPPTSLIFSHIAWTNGGYLIVSFSGAISYYGGFIQFFVLFCFCFCFCFVFVFVFVFLFVIVLFLFLFCFLFLFLLLFCFCFCFSFCYCFVCLFVCLFLPNYMIQKVDSRGQAFLSSDPAPLGANLRNAGVDSCVLRSACVDTARNIALDPMVTRNIILCVAHWYLEVT